MGTRRLRCYTAPKANDRRRYAYALAIATALTVSPAMAQSTITDIGTIDADHTSLPGKPPGYSPYAGRNFPSRVFWGDTHLHTSASMDAGAFGNRLGFEDAYRFARGEELTASGGERVKLSRPLDFLVIADHSDNMGFFPALFAGKPEMLADPTGRRWYDMVQAGGEEGVKAALEIIDNFSRGTFPPALQFLPGSDGYRSTWEQIIAAAEKYNEPGHFTAFIGYEWTSQVPPGNNLHRVVIYRDGGDKAMPDRCRSPPIRRSAARRRRTCGSISQAYEDKTGGRVLAIAHNGNLSNGWMFPTETNPATGQPLSAEYAETRARWEPLYEVTQIKGDGEAHPYLSPNDEFAGYELWDKGNLNLSEVKKPEMLQGEYARTALQTGLQLEAKLGVNPYKFGMIGSTDSHTSLATAEEDNFFGKHTGAEPSPHRADARVHAQRRRVPHGLAAGRLRLCRRVGDREHARGDLGRHAPQGGLRDHRPAHARALLRRLGLHRGRRAVAQPRLRRLRQGRADGRRPAAPRRPARRRPSWSRR